MCAVSTKTHNKYFAHFSCLGTALALSISSSDLIWASDGTDNWGWKSQPFLAQAIIGLIDSSWVAPTPQCPLWSVPQVFLGFSEDRAHSVIPAGTHWSPFLDMCTPNDDWHSQLYCCSLPCLDPFPSTAIGTSTPSEGAWLLATYHRGREGSLSQREDPESRHLEVHVPKR